MNWFIDLFTGDSILQSCIVISLVAVLGIALGKIRIKGIAFGVSVVFFMGIILGHFGLKINPIVTSFAQSFGLSIFIFSLGLQVGPSFLPSMKAGGLKLNLISLILLLTHIGLTVAIHFLSGISMPEMVGVMCGAVNNSAALGAAQQTIIDMGGDNQTVMDMALACASSYPFGVVSVLIAVTILNSMFTSRGKPLSDDDSQLERIQKQAAPVLTGIYITNPVVEGKTISELADFMGKKFIISQLSRDGYTIIPNSNSHLKIGDKILFTSTLSDENEIIKILGEYTNESWNGNTSLTSRRIFVSKPEINGKTLEQLNIRKLYNVNVTHVNRAGIDLVATPDLVILIGDRVNIVGDTAGIDTVEKKLGNAITKLDEPNLLPLFVGIIIGLILGSVPIFIPGISIPMKLGLTGGAIIVGILFGAVGYRFKLITYTTQSANLLLRELGMILYLATLGLDSGSSFFQTLFQGDGLIWVGYGMIISILPILITGWVLIKWMKMDKPTAYGTLCGNMASSQTLPYLNEITGKNTASVAYSTVYPLTMFLRVVTAQLIISMIF